MKEKTYPRSVCRSGGGLNCSNPQTINIGADFRINGRFPEYDVTRRSMGVESRGLTRKFWV